MQHKLSLSHYTLKKFIIPILIPLAFGCAQSTGNKEQLSDDIKKTEVNPDKIYFAEMEANALKVTYQGIFLEDGKVPDLFPIHSTGVSTECQAIHEGGLRRIC